MTQQRDQGDDMCEASECQNPATVEMADGLKLCGECVENLLEVEPTT